MSKLALAIRFERPDRYYVGGETVAGEVVVQAEKTTTCRALMLEHTWKTHGRGSQNRGPIHKRKLFTGTFEAGAERSFPFSFEAPAFPLTYHGTYLNIDHYVRAKADLSWALDPKAEEEFFVVPGGAGGAVEAKTHKPNVKASAGGKNIGPALVVLAGLFLVFVGLSRAFVLAPLLLFLGAFVLFFGLRKSLVGKKLGVVKVEVEPKRVALGGNVGVRVLLAPRKALRMEGATATLLAREIAVSGSGTNRTTHTHELFNEKTRMSGPLEIARGARGKLECTLAIPADTAPSFASEDNQIAWSVRLQVRIPKWPSWKHKERLIVQPYPSRDLELAEALAQEAPPPEGEVETPPPLPPPPLPELVFEPELEQELAPLQEVEPEVELEPGPEPESEPEPAPEPEPVRVPESDRETTLAAAPERPSSAGLLAAASAILATPRFGDERQASIDAALGQSFPLSLRVRQISWTFGDVGADFERGRTVIGVLEPGEQAVGVRFPAVLNQAVDALKPEHRIATAGRFVAWNSPYDRPELEAEDFDTLEEAE